MHFEFVYIYRHIYRKWVFLVDSKCRNTIILTGLTYTSSRKVFHENSFSLAHCALNTSFTVHHSLSLALRLYKETVKKHNGTHIYILFTYSHH